jgi:hypothetical protein
MTQLTALHTQILRTLTQYWRPFPTTRSEIQDALTDCVQAGYIEYDHFTDNARLTPKGLTLRSMLKEPKFIPVRDVPKEQWGDAVTLTGLRPNVGNWVNTWGHWEAKTDNLHCTKVILYPEDFKALEKAGYDMPGWEDRPYDPMDREELERITFHNSGFEERARNKKHKPQLPYFDCSIEIVPTREPVKGFYGIVMVKEVK